MTARSQHSSSGNKQAFTLIELAIAIALIGILSGISIVAYSRITARTNQEAINATAVAYERKMTHLVAGGNTSQEAYETIVTEDVPDSITFEPRDGSGIVIGGETEMSVQNSKGWTAFFTAPDNTTSGSSVTSGGIVTTTTVPADPNVTILTASNCALPELNHAVVTFGTNSSGLTADLRFQRVGQQNPGQGYTGTAFNGPLRTRSGWGAPTVNYHGPATLLGDNFPNDNNNVNWSGGPPTTSGAFPYDQALWTTWAAMIDFDSDTRLEFVDNISGPAIVTTRTGQEAPTNGQRELYVAPGTYPVTIQARSDGRKFGDAIVAPNADVTLNGGNNGLGQLRGFGVAKSFTHIGSNLGGDSWEPGYLTGMTYSCKP